MSGGLHTFTVDVAWDDGEAGGTTDYRAYTRDHVVTIAGKPDLPGSADRAFRGDPTKHTPEDLLVAALAQCHMLSFLHMAVRAGVVVTRYCDRAVGVMRVTARGSGQFTEVVLHPRVTIDAARSTPDVLTADPGLAALHEQAHDACFIAQSVNFPVLTEAVAHAGEGGTVGSGLLAGQD